MSIVVAKVIAIPSTRWTRWLNNERYGLWHMH